MAFLPGGGELEIEVWDYDLAFGDDLIGSTMIDLESRVFNRDWLAYDKKPIEWRPIYSPTSKHPQGRLQLWVDILSEEEATMPPWDITPPAQQLWELRVIVWGTAEVPAQDVAEGMTDMYVAVKFGSERVQTTDIHWRCQTGKGSFNWRCIFPVKIRHKESAKERLTVQVFDKDILESDDAVGESVVQLQSYFRKAFNSKARAQGPVKQSFIYEGDKSVRPKGMGGIAKALRDGATILSSGGAINPQLQDKDKFWLPIRGAKGAGMGYVQLSIELMPEEMARTKAAGYGRSEPNDNPVLPEPEGRLGFTLNPYSMVSSLMGPKAARRFCCACYCCFCFGFTLWLVFNTFPVLAGTGVAEAFNG